MPVGLIVLLALESFRAGSRQYNKRKAKKYHYDGVFAKDYLGRPVDGTTGKRLSRNEARALAVHRRETSEQTEKEAKWRLKGNTLPEYSQSTGKQVATKENETSLVEGSSSGAGDELQDWQSWSISGAPCYTERDEQSTSLVRT